MRGIAVVQDRAVVEIATQPANRSGVGVNRLGLQTLQLRVLETAVVLPGERRRKIVRHAGLSSRNSLAQ